MTNGSIDCGHCVAATPKTSYVTWDKPLLTSATEWLLAGESGVSADLSETLLLLPTPTPSATFPPGGSDRE